MALPIIAVPKYQLKIPSTDKEVNYRPFLVDYLSIFNQYYQYVEPIDKHEFRGII